MTRAGLDHSERDALERAALRRLADPTTYELRHYGHRRAFARWWLCSTCSELVPPLVAHGHLR